MRLRNRSKNLVIALINIELDAFKLILLMAESRHSGQTSGGFLLDYLNHCYRLRVQLIEADIDY